MPVHPNLVSNEDLELFEMMVTGAGGFGSGVNRTFGDVKFSH